MSPIVLCFCVIIRVGYILIHSLIVLLKKSLILYNESAGEKERKVMKRKYLFEMQGAKNNQFNTGISKILYLIITFFLNQFLRLIKDIIDI